jgi:hypothetical protein
MGEIDSCGLGGKMGSGSTVGQMSLLGNGSDESDALLSSSETTTVNASAKSSVVLCRDDDVEEA